MDNENVSKQELLLYDPMRSWFAEYFQNKYPDASVEVFDLHKIYLSDFFSKSELKKDFPDYPTYLIKVDLLVVIKNGDHNQLHFIEVKDGELNFSNLAQLLVYSKLVRPVSSILISPHGLNKHLNDIIKKYQRLDMLEYMSNSKIKLAKWDKHRGAIFL